jgi:hypothetical protein
MPERKTVKLIPVMDVELCPECGSDRTQCVDPRAPADERSNRCGACGHTWHSEFASGSGVYFIRPEDEVLT